MSIVKVKVKVTQLCLTQNLYYTCYPFKSAAAAAKSLQSCLTLCDPMDCSPPGSSVNGILQARILKWVAIPFSTYPGIKPRSHVFCTGRQVLYHWPHLKSPARTSRLFFVIAKYSLHCMDIAWFVHLLDIWIVCRFWLL